MTIMLLALALLCSGCISPASIIKELAKDTASNCVRINSIYATVLMSRTNLQNGSLTCNGDGLSVTSEAPLR